jgi:hypothetical protein
MNDDYGYASHPSRTSPALPLYQTPQINLPASGYSASAQPLRQHPLAPPPPPASSQYQTALSPYSPSADNRSFARAQPPSTAGSGSQQRHSVHGSMPAYSIDQAFANVNPGSLTDTRGRFSLGHSNMDPESDDHYQQQQQMQHQLHLQQQHQQQQQQQQQSGHAQSTNRALAGNGSTTGPHFLEPFTSALVRSASLGARRKGGGGADDIEAGMSFGNAGGPGYAAADQDVENGDGDGFGSRWGFGKTSTSANQSIGAGGYAPPSTGSHRGSQSTYEPYGPGSSHNLPYMGDAPQLGLDGQARRTSNNRASFASPTSPMSGLQTGAGGNIPPPSAASRNAFANTSGVKPPQQQLQSPPYGGQSSRPGYSPGGMSASLSGSPYLQAGQIMEDPPFQSMPPGGAYDQYQQQSSAYGQPRQTPFMRASSSDVSSPGRVSGMGFPNSHIPAKRERNSSGSSTGASSSVMNMTGIEGQHSPIGHFSTSPLLSTPASVPGSTQPPPGALGGPRQALANRSRSSQQLNTSRVGSGGLHLQPSAIGPMMGISSAPGMTDAKSLARGREAEYEMTGISRTSTGYAENDKRVGLRKVVDPTKDLRPSLDSQPGERRADPDVPGAFLSVSAARMHASLCF